MQKTRLSIVGLIILFLMTIPLSTRHSQAQAFGSWTAQFYNNTNFAAPIAGTAVYQNGLNFVWPSFPLQQDNITRVPGVTVQDNFSVIFTSTVPLNAGVYTFSGNADDAITVLINGAQVFQSPGPPPQRQFAFAYTVPTAGQYSIVIRFIEYQQSATLTFTWQQGTGPTSTPSGPFANVVNVRGLSLRTGPYLGASFIAVLRPENSYPVSAKNTTEGGGYTWYRVMAGDKLGWASGRYLVVTSEGQVPVATTVFQELSNPAETRVTAIPRAIMNLRQYPSQRSPLLDQIPWGAELPLYNRTIQGGRNHWFQVKYHDKIGWIYAPYVGWRGNIDQVPIR